MSNNCQNKSGAKPHWALHRVGATDRCDEVHVKANRFVMAWACPNENVDALNPPCCTLSSNNNNSNNYHCDPGASDS
jgi:hypothetical protein